MSLYDEIYAQVNIPIEGFYVFYEVPWDETKYVKFTCPSISRGNPDSPDSRDTFHFTMSPDFDLDDTNHTFHGAKYLGGARLTDSIYLTRILKDRTELEQ